jgi:hypothetical protein
LAVQNQMSKLMRGIESSTTRGLLIRHKKHHWSTTVVGRESIDGRRVPWNLHDKNTQRFCQSENGMNWTLTKA